MKPLKSISISLLLCITVLFSYGQKPHSSGEIYSQLEKLNFLGSMLYVAAHPDDENTALISYFATHENARTAYLSLTRGDGGQNLIGSDIREMLGVIRTEELIAARNIDKGEQYFSAAVDFGFSKHPDETLNIWDEKQLLEEIVNRIRTFQPDIIINRFKHDTPGSTHGHHTASAILSKKAFELASDPTYLPNTPIWTPKRLFFNTSWWFYGSRENFEKADKSSMIKIDVGTFDPITGKTNAAIAANSRSQHKSQGFGSSAILGKYEQYIDLIAGELPKNNDAFEGINTSWTRIEGGEKIQPLVSKALAEFDFKDPSKSIPSLLSIHKEIKSLPPNTWKEIKLQEIESLIKACAGLTLQANSKEPYGSNGSDTEITLNGVNKSTISIRWDKVINQGQVTEINKNMVENERISNKLSWTPNNSFTTPYWLLEKGSLGSYAISDSLSYKGSPKTPDNKITFDLTINGYPISFEESINYRYTSRTKGEVVQPFQILPKASVTSTTSNYLFDTPNSKKIPLEVQSFTENVSGEVVIKSPDGWRISPEKIPFNFSKKEEKKEVVFTVTPLKNAKKNTELISPKIVLNTGETIPYNIKKLDYDHIPQQFVLMPNEIKLVKLNIKKPLLKIGFIEGAGESTMESLLQIGMDVEKVDVNTMTLASLKNYNTIILGIRAFNTLEELKSKNKVLWEFAAQGGTLLIQYNTTRGLKTKDLTPYKLTLSRDRVTDENSEVEILNPSHPILNTPNKISKTDFEGWVQERGLYFPNAWGDEFTPLLAMNDKGESLKKGALLVATYGEGKIVYTGLSFFRQFPAGVPGAYRLFINLINNEKEH